MTTSTYLLLSLLVLIPLSTSLPGWSSQDKNKITQVLHLPWIPIPTARFCPHISLATSQKPHSTYWLSSSHSILSVSRTDYATFHVRTLTHIVSSPQSPLFFSFQWPNSFSCLVSWLLKDWEINLPFYRFWETCTTRFSSRQECRMNIKEEEDENNWG